MLLMNKMTQQGVGLNRNTIDQYFTKPELSKNYIDMFFKVVEPTKDDIVIEPSAGSGSFSDALKATSECTILCYDIEPKKEGIVKTDFLELDTSIFEDITVHCIGNPPFGRQSSMAKKFIKKCASFSQSISFILPKSFKKPSFYKAFPANFHKVYEVDCPINSFTVNDKEYDVPCVFQIWLKKDTPRNDEVSEKPRGYMFVSKNEVPHFALRRVGFYAGHAFRECANKSVQSHYFIKLEQSTLDTCFDIDNLINRLNEIQYEFNNTVGAKSISKPEFIRVLNAELDYSLEPVV